MSLRVRETAIPGVLVIEPAVFADARGFFKETYQSRRYAASGIARVFVQDNHSRSCRGTVRGLHYQLRHPQAKLVCVARGEVMDVAVDIRKGSPTFGRSVSVVLSDANHRQLFVPEGFAHGFCVLSDEADLLYKCTDYYAPGDEYGILWSDPDLGIDWPVTAPIISAKDEAYLPLVKTPADNLPSFSP